jgi:hypothetical protein
VAFKTDGGGIAFKCSDAKLQANASTWATKLSQLARQEGVVRIVTYSLPDMKYVRVQLGRRPKDILLIAHSQFTGRAIEIKRAFPSVRVAVHDQVHSKILLIAPETITISSANFGDSDWHETSVSFHSKEAHDWYVEKVFVPLWQSCQEVQ